MTAAEISQRHGLLEKYPELSELMPDEIITQLEQGLAGATS